MLGCDCDRIAWHGMATTRAVSGMAARGGDESGDGIMRRWVCPRGLGRRWQTRALGVGLNSSASASALKRRSDEGAGTSGVEWKLQGTPAPAGIKFGRRRALWLLHLPHGRPAQPANGQAQGRLSMSHQSTLPPSPLVIQAMARAVSLHVSVASPDPIACGPTDPGPD